MATLVQVREKRRTPDVSAQRHLSRALTSGRLENDRSQTLAINRHLRLYCAVPGFKYDPNMRAILPTHNPQLAIVRAKFADQWKGWAS